MIHSAFIFHQLKADLRQFRWFIALFLAVSFVAVVSERLFLPGEADDILFHLLRFAQMLLLPLLVLQVFMADSVADDCAHWRTRPIPREALLLAKISYVVLALWLPGLVCYVGGWIYDGLTLRQMTLAGAELTLYTACAAGPMVALASVSASYWRAFGVGAFILGIIVVSGFLAHFLNLREQGWWWHVSPQVQFAVGFFVPSVSGLGACITSYLMRRPQWGIWWLLPVGLTMAWLPTSSSDDLVIKGPHPKIQVSRPLDDRSEEIILAGNIALKGVPENNSVIAVNSDFTFYVGGTPMAIFQMNPAALDVGWRDRVMARFEPVLKRRFANLEMSYLSYDSRRFIDINRNRELNEKEKGRLEGTCTYVLHEMHDAGSSSLASRMTFKVGGQQLRVRVQRQRDLQNELHMDLALTSPALLFANRLSDRGDSRRKAYNLWLLVFEFPESDEFIAQVVNPSLFQGQGGPFPFTRTRLAVIRMGLPVGVDVERNPPVVHAFCISAVNAFSHALGWDNHRVHTSLKRPRPFSGQDVDPAYSDPENGFSTLNDLVRFRDFNYQKSWQERAVQRKKMEEIIAGDVPGALARAPWHAPIHEIVLNVLGDVLEEEHKSALRDAMVRDPRLIQLVEDKGWEMVYRDYIATRVARRSPVEELSLLRSAAQLRDPMLYDHLKWHFIHSRQGRKDTLYSILSQLPDFDARATLEEAWRRSRLTGQEYGLTWVALEQGLPGGLASSLRILWREGEPSRETYSDMAKDLQKLTGFEGSPREFYAWISRNADQLDFDPDTGQYRLGSRDK